MPSVKRKIARFFYESGKDSQAWDAADRAAQRRMSMRVSLEERVPYRKGPAEMTDHRDGNLSSRLFERIEPKSAKEAKEIERFEQEDE
ncbi:MAG: hypothetical protein O3B04_05860 [Chloroflexi bacterium]|nr:hypothetical protein [Chloroflexota bacterium]